MPKSKIISFVNSSKGRKICSLLITLLFLASIIYYGPADHEEYLNTTISLLLNAKSLHSGKFLLWEDNLGFGTPMPLGHDNTLNPLFWLWPFIPLTVLMGIYWSFHTFLASIYFTRLLKHFAVSGIVFYSAIISYVFSMPFLTLVYLNDWPTLFFNWAMFPIWLYYSVLLVEKHHITKPFFATVRLGLLVGICLVNAHFGYLSVLLTTSGLVIFFLALRIPKAFLNLAVAGIIAAIIGSANISYVMSELLYFPKGIIRFAEDGYTIKQIIAAFVQPLSLEWLLNPVAPKNIEEIWNSFLSVNRNVRVMALGAPFMVAALVSSFVAIKQTQWKIICFAIGFIFAVSMTLLNPDDLYGIPSGTWLFRDMAVFFGIVIAANFLQNMKQSKRVYISIAQIVIVLLLAVPSIYYNVHNHSYYRDAETPTPIIAEMIASAKGHGTRIYFAPHIEKYLERGNYKILNDPFELALQGLAPVNGWFKGVSQDIFFPSASLMHGFIKGNKATLENQKLLDLMGIELIVADDTDLPLKSNLTKIWSKKLNSGNTIYLLQNKTAWKRAWLMDSSARNIALKTYNNCDKAGFLCADVRELAKTKLSDEATIAGENAYKTAQFLPAQNERLLVFSSLYRKDWKASSDSVKLNVFPLAGALLAVEIPAGVSEVTLEYKPEPRLTLRIISLICFSACIAFLLMNLIWLRKISRLNYE